MIRHLADDTVVRERPLTYPERVAVGIIDVALRRVAQVYDGWLILEGLEHLDECVSTVKETFVDVNLVTVSVCYTCTVWVCFCCVMQVLRWDVLPCWFEYC